MAEVRDWDEVRATAIRALIGAATDFRHDDIIIGSAGHFADAVLDVLKAAAKREYAQQMKSGAWHIEPDYPEVLAIYPLADRIAAAQRFGGGMYRRTVVVTEDWKRLRKGARS